MKTNHFFAAGLATGILLVASSQTWATTYSGNGDTSFGGPIGGATLTLSDDGTTISGSINKGPNGFNDALVLYIESGPGGFSSTAGFNDAADGLRKAISGIDGNGNRSTMTFTGGFAPNYAIALGPSDDSYGGLWQLANGGNNSLTSIAGVNLTPLNNSSATYTFSVPVSQLGLTPNSGATIELFGTYTSDTGYRSSEAIAGTDAGTTGWNDYIETANGTYTIQATPEPASMALVTLGGILAAAVVLRRR